MNRVTLDGWMNAFTGIGTNKDKRMYTRMQGNIAMTSEELTNIFRADGIGARVVKIPAQDMTRNGFVVSGDDSEEINTKLDEMSINFILQEALVLDRLFGGSVIIMYIDDGQILEMPVNILNIKNISGFQVYDRWDVQYSSFDLYNNPNNPKYGKPQYYTISNISTGSSFRVHESRLMVFEGDFLPLRARLMNNGWGDSCLESVYERIKGIAEGYISSEHILSEFVANVLKIKNLDTMLADDEGTKEVKSRLEMIDITRHTQNTYVLDENESLERLSASTAGMAELLKILKDAVSATSGIPILKLYGEQAQGLGGEAAGTLRLYYDDIASYQQQKLKPQLEKLVKYLFAMYGEIEDWKIVFNPLWQPTQKEKLETQKMQADIDSLYHGMGLPEEIILQNRFGQSEFSYNTILPDAYKMYIESKINTTEFEEEPEQEDTTEQSGYNANF